MSLWHWTDNCIWARVLCRTYASVTGFRITAQMWSSKKLYGILSVTEQLLKPSKAANGHCGQAGYRFPLVHDVFICGTAVWGARRNAVHKKEQTIACVQLPERHMQCLLEWLSLHTPPTSLLLSLPNLVLVSVSSPAELHQWCLSFVGMAFFWYYAASVANPLTHRNQCQQGNSCINLFREMLPYLG